MNNYPYINHTVVKYLFKPEVSVDIGLTDTLGQKIIEELGLTIVREFSHEFTKEGLTKIWVLSESHLIIHTWPELHAIHIDLMTCREDLDTDKLKKLLESMPVDKYTLTKLFY